MEFRDIRKAFRHLRDILQLDGPVFDIAEAAYDLDVRKLTDRQLDDLKRVGSGLIIAARSEMWRREGFKIRRWDAKGPATKRLPYGQWEVTTGPFPFDHGYVLTQKGGPKFYVVEPYGITETGLRALVAALDEGWIVNVDERFGLHFPGACVPIVCERPVS